MITKEKEAMIKEYNAGLAAYKERRWDDAITLFQKALDIDPEDGPSKIYLERSAHNKVNPPDENWDGVFTMTTK